MIGRVAWKDSYDHARSVMSRYDNPKFRFLTTAREPCLRRGDAKGGAPQCPEPYFSTLTRRP